MRPTTEFETLRKDPKLVFQFVKDKISSMSKDKNVHIANYSSCEPKHMVGVFVESLRSVETVNQSLEAHESFCGCLRVFVVNLDAEGHEFAASF